MASEESERAFEEIMFQVGNSGRFQKIFNVVFNFLCVLVGTMASFNVVLAIIAPGHWCKVPGREFTNYSIEEWKSITIPQKSNSTKYEECKMFNETSFIADNQDYNDTIGCSYGWEYDNTYFGKTIATQENWVCDQEMYGTNFLVFGKIGEIVGTAVLAQVGDIYGRRPIFYASIVILVIGKLGLLLSTGAYWLFIAFSIIGSLPNLTFFQAPMVISVEISSVEDRSFIPLYQCIGWTVGLCITPLVFWVLREWMPFILVTTLPLVIFLALPRYMIESPRWLASAGKLKKCVTELKKIAKINNSEISEKVIENLNNITFTPEKKYGAMSLFSSRNLAKKSILIIIGWVCYLIFYLIIFFNVSNLGGNPFMNYFWQGLAELPGYFLGKYLCGTIGRKLTKFIGFVGLVIMAIILAYILSLPNQIAVVVSICGVMLRFISSIEFYAINLQTLELYPTCLRQTGSSLGFLLASFFGIFAPYITHLGTAVHPSIPYIVGAILALLGGISGIFLPETLNEKLPETVGEAEHFGNDQRLWSLPKGTSFTHKRVSNKVI